MRIFYSAEARGFFDELHPSIPADAVEVTPEDHAALMEAQAKGKSIAPDADGKPIAVDPPEPTREERLAALRRKRDRLLRDSDFTQIPDAPLSPERREAWRAYRQALRDLPELYADDPANAVWPTPPKEETTDAS